MSKDTGNQLLCCVPLSSETRIYELPSRKYRSIEVEVVYFQVGNSEFCEHPDIGLGNTSWELRVSEPNGTHH